MHYGARIKEYLTDHDIKQKKLAEQLGISPAMLSHYLTGRNEMPIDTLIKLSEMFQLSLEYLVGISDQPEQPMTLSAGERELITAFRTLSPDQREIIQENLRLMQKQNRR